MEKIVFIAVAIRDIEIIDQGDDLPVGLFFGQPVEIHEDSHDALVREMDERRIENGE